MAKKKQGRSIKAGFFRKNYRESWDYIKDSRKFIYAVAFIFLLFFLIGFFIPAPAGLQRIILQFIEKLVLETKGLSWSQLISFIFFNNVQSSFVGMFFGIFLGIFSVFTTLANGYLLGFVAEKTVSGEGFLVLWRLFPHGIFELPALMISLGLGIKLGSFSFQKNRFESLRYYILKSIQVFIFIVIPLLIIAAIIEGSLISLVG